MIDVRRAADRFRTDQVGIRTWHCLSAGAHYDPDRVSFGPLIGLDEHHVAPAGGFDWHAHRGVHIVSWVLAGALRHEDPDGGARVVEPGTVLVQSAGGGIRHRETNDSTSEPLRFVQTTILGNDAPGVRLTSAPIALGDAVFDVVHAVDEIGPAHVFVARGEFAVSGGQVLEVGDSARITDEAVKVTGAGELLVVRVEP